MTAPPVIRPLRTHAELVACLELQRLTWGAHFSETVPPAILTVVQRIGGIAAGAFAPDDVLLGFVFGMTGVERGRLVHWSDMLAVRAEARDRGIGRLLKEHQRAHCLALGVGTIYWTYDPLVARNAHLNLVRLGARAVEYVPDMYGAETDSPLHRGIGSDRLVVAWDLTPASAAPGGAGPGAPPDPVRAWRSPVLNEGGVMPALAALAPDAATHALLEAGGAVRIEIPCDIAAAQARALEEAARWRASTRAAFTTALARGWRVSGFRRSADGMACHYLLVPGA